ncbi:hypothetical protein H5T51_07985, partial [Candidatus Bathyarchaeota archaeon]|nr:hypothetical protein [Candidatus Bathyarchaeota archaeon]
MVFAAAAFYLPLKFAFSDAKKGDKRLKRFKKPFSMALAVLMIISLYVSRWPLLPDKLSEAVSYYSYISEPFHQGALWLRGNYPENTTIVVTEKPGLFFGMASGKYAIMETNPTIERTPLAEATLNLAYELESPITLFQVFEASMPYELDRYNVLVHGVWKRASFLYSEENTVCYTVNGKQLTVKLSDLPRKISWINKDEKKILQVQYVCEGDFILLENIEMADNMLPVKVNWTFTPISGKITNLLIHLSIHFDLNLLFNVTYVPGVFDWGNPWDKPTAHGVNYSWVLTGFNTEIMPGDSIAVYAPANRTFFAIKFLDIPDYANIGALAHKQIDGLRLYYEFMNVTNPVSFAYLVVNLSEESVSHMKLNLEGFQELFELKSKITVKARDYITYMHEYQIRFLVYDKEKFREELLN